MGEINKQVTVNVEPKQVYRFVSDPRNAPRYISSIVKVHSGPEGQPAIGQVWKAEADFLGQRRHLTLRIDELLPDKLVRFALEGEPEAVLQLRLTGDGGQGRTAVALSMDVTGVPTLLLNALLGGLLSQDLTRLQRVLERDE